MGEIYGALGACWCWEPGPCPTHTPVLGGKGPARKKHAETQQGTTDSDMHIFDTLTLTLTTPCSGVGGRISLLPGFESRI